MSHLVELTPETAPRSFSIRRASRHALVATTLAAWLGGCGVLDTYAVGVTVTTPIAAGETFTFALQGTTQTIAVTQSGASVAFAEKLDPDTAYTVAQTAGPRACTLSANRTGTITADVEVTADCGGGGGGGGGKTALTVEVRGPVGTSIVLQNNGGDDLSVTLPAVASSSDDYNTQSVAFATQLSSGAAYAVTLKTVPQGYTCAVYKGGTGTMPVAAQAVKVGCEYSFDHLSRSTTDTVRGTYYDSSAPAIGGDTQYGEGRFVAFVSSADLGGNAAGKRQIWWRDRLTGETRLISTDASGVAGNGDSFAPAISADGLTVAFESYAQNLVASDANGVRDVFVWSAAGGTIPTGVTRVSVGVGGVEANSDAYEPTVSGDGSVVAFSTSASTLTTGVSGTSTVNVVRRDLKTGTNTLVSAAGGVGVGGSKPSISADGKRLAFYSYSSELVANDTNGRWDIFVFDTTAALRRVSLTETGGERDQGNESNSRVVAPAISGNGRYVAYATTATNVVAGDTNNAQDVFVVDLDGTPTVRRVSVNGASQGNADSPIGQGERVGISHDGAFVAFTTSATTLGVPAGNVVIYQASTGQLRAVTTSASSVGPAVVSRTGAYVAFGAGTALDKRFTSTGLFGAFTGLTRAWYWLD